MDPNRIEQGDQVIVNRDYEGGRRGVVIYPPSDNDDGFFQIKFNDNKKVTYINPRSASLRNIVLESKSDKQF